MGRRSEIPLINYAMHRNIKLNKAGDINEHAFLDEGYYYYVKNDYNDPMYGHTAVLYAFKIVKTTNCYHFLANGKRVDKRCGHPDLKKTPGEAMGRARNRAKRYLTILRSRAENVFGYLNSFDPPSRTAEADLRAFERFLKRLDNIDSVPDHLIFDPFNRPEQELDYI